MVFFVIAAEMDLDKGLIKVCWVPPEISDSVGLKNAISNKFPGEVMLLAQ